MDSKHLQYLLINQTFFIHNKIVTVDNNQE